MEIHVLNKLCCILLVWVDQGTTRNITKIELMEIGFEP